MDQQIRTAERAARAAGDDVEARARLGADRKRRGTEGFEAASAEWLAGAEEIVKQTYEREEDTEEERVARRRALSFEKGRKYWRVVATQYGQRSAFCFLDSTTGDVLKPAGWAGPAQHARGSVFDADGGLTCVGPYGVAYLTSRGVQLTPLGKRG